MNSTKPIAATHVMAEALVADRLRERRLERRWKRIACTLFIGGSLALSLS